MGFLNEQVTETTKALRNVQDNIRTFEEAQKKAKTNLDYAINHGYTTVAKWQAEYDSWTKNLEQAQEALAVAEGAHEVAVASLAAVRAERNQQRVVAALAAAEIGTDVLVRVDWGHWMRLGASSRWELKLIEMLDGAPVFGTYKNRDDGDKEVTYTKTRFGFEADVSGPQRDWRGEKWEVSSKVSWGSMGAQTVADASELLRVHTMGVKLATYLDQVRDEWYAEDMAD